MSIPKATITYLFHSGYAVETKQHFCIFDYYQPFSAHGGGVSDGIITSKYLKSKSNVYVFVSHGHADHFDRRIFDWAAEKPEIVYILSNDIAITDQNINSCFMGPYEIFNDGDIHIKTFGSTDEGLSFYIQVDGVSIFHAGDLNWWHWKGESKAEQSYAETIFKAEIEKIKGHSIDIAFFPVDRRLEEFYALGAEYFAEHLRPKILLPMHFGTDFEASKKFAAEARKTSFSTVQINRKGQQIIF